MNIQARIDYLTEMRQSALYEARSNDLTIGIEFSSVAHSLEEAIATLEYIQTLKNNEDFNAFDDVGGGDGPTICE